MACVSVGGLGAGVRAAYVLRCSLVCVIMLTLSLASLFSFCSSKCWWASGFAETPMLSTRPEETDVHGRCPRGCLRYEFMQLPGNERKQRVCFSSGAGLCSFVRTQMWRLCLARGERLEEGLPWRQQHQESPPQRTAGTRIPAEGPEFLGFAPDLG